MYLGVPPVLHVHLMPTNPTRIHWRQLPTNAWCVWVISIWLFLLRARFASLLACACLTQTRYDFHESTNRSRNNDVADQSPLTVQLDRGGSFGCASLILSAFSMHVTLQLVALWLFLCLFVTLLLFLRSTFLVDESLRCVLLLVSRRDFVVSLSKCLLKMVLAESRVFCSNKNKEWCQMEWGYCGSLQGLMAARNSAF